MYTDEEDNWKMAFWWASECSDELTLVRQARVAREVRIVLRSVANSGVTNFMALV